MSDKTIVRNKDIAPLLAALNALDGRQEAVEIKDREGNKSTVINTVPYKFSGEARLAAARWLKAMNDAHAPLKTTHDALVRQHAAPDKPEEVAPGNMRTYTDEWEAVGKLENEFDLPKIKIAGLKVEENMLPVSVLALLAPVLDTL